MQKQNADTFLKLPLKKQDQILLLILVLPHLKAVADVAEIDEMELRRWMKDKQLKIELSKMQSWLFEFMLKSFSELPEELKIALHDGVTHPTNTREQTHEIIIDLVEYMLCKLETTFCINKKE